MQQQQKKNLGPTVALKEKLHVTPDTIRRGLCLKGHYMGMVPIKLPNGRLLWDLDQADRILNGERIEAQTTTNPLS